LTKGIQKCVGNAILIKLNQIGTVRETLKTIELAYKNSNNRLVSHPGGETVDSFISDLLTRNSSFTILIPLEVGVRRSWELNEV